MWSEVCRFATCTAGESGLSMLLGGCADELLPHNLAYVMDTHIRYQIQMSDSLDRTLQVMNLTSTWSLLLAAPYGGFASHCWSLIYLITLIWSGRLMIFLTEEAVTAFQRRRWWPCHQVYASQLRLVHKPDEEEFFPEKEQPVVAGQKILCGP